MLLSTKRCPLPDSLDRETTNFRRITRDPSVDFSLFIVFSGLDGFLVRNIELISVGKKELLGVRECYVIWQVPIILW